MSRKKLELGFWDSLGLELGLSRVGVGIRVVTSCSLGLNYSWEELGLEIGLRRVEVRESWGWC